MAGQVREGSRVVVIARRSGDLVIPPDAYRPAPGWYRYHDVLRWHDGHQWTDRTRPLPNARTQRRRTSMSLAAVVASVLALTAAAAVLGIWRAIS